MGPTTQPQISIQQFIYYLLTGLGKIDAITGVFLVPDFITNYNSMGLFM